MRPPKTVEKTPSLGPQLGPGIGCEPLIRHDCFLGIIQEKD
jgi:hypothetical protein